MQPTGGLKLFERELHPAILGDVLSWERDAELSSLLAKLRSHTARKAFFDSWAEAVIARHSRASRGCEVRLEVPTPHDRRADFEVARDGVRFFLHLKRIETDRPARRHMIISSRLRVLERIRRPYVVQVRWHDGLADEQMQSLVQQAEEFIQQGHIGEEMRARDHDGREIGGVRILAPSEGEHVSVTIGLPTGFIDLSPRIRRLLNRAHEQFMPREANVILIASNHDDDVIDFESALLGSHIERWDQFPPRGKRIAHGRAPDGFWHGRRFADSALAAWARFTPREDQWRSRPYVRKATQPGERGGGGVGVTQLLQSLFEGE